MQVGKLAWPSLNAMSFNIGQNFPNHFKSLCSETQERRQSKFSASTSLTETRHFRHFCTTGSRIVLIQKFSHLVTHLQTSAVCKQSKSDALKQGAERKRNRGHSGQRGYSRRKISDILNIPNLMLLKFAGNFLTRDLLKTNQRAVVRPARCRLQGVRTNVSV